MRTTPKDGTARDGTITLVRSDRCPRGCHTSPGVGVLENSAIMHIQEAIFGAGQIVRVVLSAEVTGRPHERNQRKNWQTDSELKNLAGYAPQESGPSEHKNIFLGSRHKDNRQASKTHIGHFRRRLQHGPHARRCGGWRAAPLRDAHGQWSAQRYLRGGSALEPGHMAKPVQANPRWEGNTWQGRNRAQSRPDHVLLSVDLTAPP